MGALLERRDGVPRMDLQSMLAALESLGVKMRQAIDQQKVAIEAVDPVQRMSATNLIRYLVLRREDIRSLQDELHIAGLSSLASSESHILHQLQAIQQRLGKEFDINDLSTCDYYTGRSLIRERASQLFGPRDSPDIPYLMVTFDAGFVGNASMVKELLKSGMNIARINCAHDDPEVWKKMIRLVNKAGLHTGIPCKIYMDLAGPKIRTKLLGKRQGHGKVSLKKGQKLILADADADYGRAKVVIGCNESGIIRQLKVNERVLFDDGLIETQVVSNTAGVATLRVLRISNKKSQLKSDKGINFPDSELQLPSITERDRLIIPFICRHADIIGYSFVRSAEGVAELQQLLSENQPRPRVILKIETPQAVRAFPSLLMQGLKEHVFGVMIARGDLAVEIGFERMSEIQEEISWICEAAHVPIVWATQVLETLNKSGVATRSEITDAYRAARAECVMINKGDHTIRVMKTLADILQRSGGHHVKKRYTFRPMQIAKDYFNAP